MDKLQLIVRALVTLALLAYGFMLHQTDPEIGSVIIGGVLGYWLREGEGHALRLRDQRRDRGADPTTPDPFYDRPDTLAASRDPDDVPPDRGLP